jgi:hypothetical protein
VLTPVSTSSSDRCARHAVPASTRQTRTR